MEFWPLTVITYWGVVAGSITNTGGSGSGALLRLLCSLCCVWQRRVRAGGRRGACRQPRRPGRADAPGGCQRRRGPAGSRRRRHAGLAPAVLHSNGSLHARAGGQGGDAAVAAVQAREDQPVRLPGHPRHGGVRRRRDHRAAAGSGRGGGCVRLGAHGGTDAGIRACVRVQLSCPRTPTNHPLKGVRSYRPLQHVARFDRIFRIFNHCIPMAMAMGRMLFASMYLFRKVKTNAFESPACASSNALVPAPFAHSTPAHRFTS